MAKKSEIIELRNALSSTLRMYVQLADSGDCGFWNSAEEPHVIEARRVLAKYEKLNG